MKKTTSSKGRIITVIIVASLITGLFIPMTGSAVVQPKWRYDSRTLIVGETINPSLIPCGPSAGNLRVYPIIPIKSSNKKVIAIKKKGGEKIFKAVKPGTSTIIFKYNNKKRKYKYTVYPKSKVRIPCPKYMLVGGECALDNIVINGTSYAQVYKNGVSNKKSVVKILNEKVLKNQANIIDAVIDIKAKKSGTAKLTLTTIGGTKITHKIKVYSKSDLKKKITLTKVKMANGSGFFMVKNPTPLVIEANCTLVTDEKQTLSAGPISNNIPYAVGFFNKEHPLKSMKVTGINKYSNYQNETDYSVPLNNNALKAQIKKIYTGFNYKHGKLVVKNTGSEMCDSLSVTVICKDASGNPIGYLSYYDKHIYIKPGKSKTIEAYGHSAEDFSEAASYDYYIQGYTTEDAQ